MSMNAYNAMELVKDGNEAQTVVLGSLYETVRSL